MIEPKVVTYSLVVFSLIGSIFISGCISGTGVNPLPSSKYVVIEEERLDSSVLIGGNPARCMEIPAPPIFWYTKEHYSSDYPPLNESLKILYGTYYSVTTPENYLKTLNVRAIYGYPDELESGPTVIEVDENGTVYMVYNNRTISLEPGATWESPVKSTRNETVQGRDIVNRGNYTYDVEFTRTWTVTNRGVYDK